VPKLDHKSRATARAISAAASHPNSVSQRANDETQRLAQYRRQIGRDIDRVSNHQERDQRI
jgi:hypothetical protein